MIVQVPTVDTYRNSYWSEIMILHHYHLLLTGPTGTGKTLCIKDKLLNDLPKENWSPILLRCVSR